MYLLKKPKRYGFLILVRLLIFAISLPVTAFAVPYVPENDNVIVETMPLRWADSEMRSLRRLHKILDKNPTDVTIAANVAKKYLELARQHDDPRFYGYAESVLSPWDNIDVAPIPIMILRATIYQHFHHFDAALNELDQLLKIDKTNAQAWLSKASILLVTGQPKKSLKSCTALITLAEPLITTTCISSALSLQGYARKAYTRLKTLYGSTTSISNNIEIWVLTTLAEIAQRLGDYKESNTYYKKALVINNNDSYLISSYADHLLFTERYREAFKLLETRTKNSAHLLRLILAEQALQLPEYNNHKALLSERYHADAERKTMSHLRDLARFNLHILNSPEIAFQVATQNWKDQKEPGDAYILLESAIATNSPSALQMINSLLDNNAEDRQLSMLSEKLKRKM